jgi:glycerophosphoryl diester phosphodiesterase
MIFFYIVGWFVFAHSVLLRVFTCCKRKTRLDLAKIKAHNKKWPIISSHRGGSFERTENTLTAFKHAMENQSNLLECDVHLTKDGVVLVSHDEDLVRLCGVDELIEETNYHELPPMMRSVPLHFSDGCQDL